MPIQIGLRTNTHIFICSEKILSSSLVKIKDCEESTVDIAGTLASLSGDQSDAFRMTSFLQQYSRFLSVKYKERIFPELIARLLSTEIHDSLRKRRMNVNGVIGGRSEDNTLRLFCVDQYGALHEDDFVVTSYGVYFLMGIFDMKYRKDMSEEEGLMMLNDCIKTLKERFVLDTGVWGIEIIGPEGRKSHEIKV